MRNSPRMPERSRVPDPHAIDLRWALGRARDWLLGSGPLIANLSLLVLATIGAVLWQLSQDPSALTLPGWAIGWGVVVAIHAGIVASWGTLRSWRSPRRRPVYYRDIPVEQRSRSRAASGAHANVPAPVAPVAPVAPAAPASRPTWQGVLAPVTPFPTLRAPDPDGSVHAPTEPAAARHPADPAAAQQTAPTGAAAVDAPLPERPALAARDSALADVRGVLANDQPLWRRWRRRAGDRTEPVPVPIEAVDSWLAPFPGAPPVTRPAGLAPNPGDGSVPRRVEHGSAQAPGSARWPTSPPAGPAQPPAAGRTPEVEQIPSLAAMLRSSNLTSVADAPISGPQPRPTDGVPAPAPMPARQPVAGTPQPRTTALFTAFGIDGDGQPVQPDPAPDATETPTKAVSPGPRRLGSQRPPPR